MAKTKVHGEYLQDSVVRFTAKAGENITKGQPVYISGISGELPVVSLADADDTAKMPAFGLAEATVTTNAEVEITSFGTLAGLNTSSYSLGDILYVDTTAGALTNNPSGLEATKLQNIGIVQRVHASNGSIKVGGAGRTNAVPNLDDGDIFIGDSNNKAISSSLATEIESYLDGGTSTPTFSTATVTGDLTVDTNTLYVNSSTNNVGIGMNNPAYVLDVTDTSGNAYISVNRGTQSQGEVGYKLGGGTGGGQWFIYQPTSSNDIRFYQGSDKVTFDTSGNVGIGNTSPLGKLTISNAAGANAPTTVTAANTYLQLGSEDYGSSSNGKFMIGFGYTNATNTNSPAYIGYEEANNGGQTYGDLTFYTRTVTTDTAPTERMRIAGNGSVKIWHGATTNYTSFEEANEINTYTAAGVSSTMYLNHNGGDVNLRSGSMEVKDNGDVVIGNTTISPASAFSDQRGIGYDASTGFTEIAATSEGAPLEIGTNNASGSAILSLRKQGNVVGGISTFDGEAHFGRYTAGIMPIGSATTPRVVPTNFSAGTLANNTVDLGSGSARWKDFYMAGDMNVGSQTSNVVPANRKAWFQGGGSYFTSYTAGQSTITTDASGLIVGTPSTRTGTANYYTAGISFDHLLNYSTTGNVTYNTYPHAWIGLKTYDFPGYERSSLVLATRNDTSGAGPTAEQLVISPYGEITMPNQPSARFYCTSGASVGSETVINSTNTGAIEHFDRNGDYNASTGEFTTPVAGVYLAYAYSNFYGGTNPGYFRLQYYNGSSWVNYAISYKSDTSSWNSVTLFTTIEASAGIKLRFVYAGDPDAGFDWFYGGWHLLG